MVANLVTVSSIWKLGNKEWKSSYLDILNKLASRDDNTSTLVTTDEWQLCRLDMDVN